MGVGLTLSILTCIGVLTQSPVIIALGDTTICLDDSVTLSIPDNSQTADQHDRVSMIKIHRGNARRQKGRPDQKKQRHAFLWRFLPYSLQAAFDSPCPIGIR